LKWANELWRSFLYGADIRWTIVYDTQTKLEMKM